MHFVFSNIDVAWVSIYLLIYFSVYQYIYWFMHSFTGDSLYTSIFFYITWIWIQYSFISSPISLCLFRYSFFDNWLPPIFYNTYLLSTLTPLDPKPHWPLTCDSPHLDGAGGQRLRRGIPPLPFPSTPFGSVQWHHSSRAGWITPPAVCATFACRLAPAGVDQLVPPPPSFLWVECSVYFLLFIFWVFSDVKCLVGGWARGDVGNYRWKMVGRQVGKGIGR